MRNSEKLKLEEALAHIEDACGSLNVRRNFRHNDRNNDFVGSEDDENAIFDAEATLLKAIRIIKPLAGY